MTSRSRNEQQLFEIFERKNKFIEQIRHQTLQFDQLLASKLAIRGISPPPWLSNNPNGLPVPHFQPAISCSSSHFPLLNGNAQDIKSYHSGLPNDSIVEFRASNVGLDAGQEQSLSPRHVTDHSVNVFNPFLKQDTSVVSPHHLTDAQDLGILQGNPESLIKIQRSKSRQRALELRNSAKTAKGCTRDESNAITGAITGSGIALLQSDNPNVPEFLQAVENNSERSSIEGQADDCGSEEKNGNFSFGVVTTSTSSGHNSKSMKEVVCEHNMSDIANEFDATLTLFCGTSSVQTSNNMTQLHELPNNFSICNKEFREDTLIYEGKEKETSVSGRIKGSSSYNPEPDGESEPLKKGSFSSNAKNDRAIGSAQELNNVSEIDELLGSSQSPLDKPILAGRDGMEDRSFTDKHPDITPAGSSHRQTNSRKRSLQHEDCINAGKSKAKSINMRSSRNKRSKKSGQQQSSLQETKTEVSSLYVANKNYSGLVENVDMPVEALKSPVSCEKCIVEQSKKGGDQESKDRGTNVSYRMATSESFILLPESMGRSPNLQKSVVQEDCGLSKEKNTKCSSKTTRPNHSAHQCTPVNTAGNLSNDEDYINGKFPQFIGKPSQFFKAVNERIEVLDSSREISESHRAEEAKIGDCGIVETENSTSCRMTRGRSSRLSCDSVNDVLKNDSFFENGKEELELTEEPANVDKLKELMEEKVDDSLSKGNSGSVYSGRITRSKISGKQPGTPRAIFSVGTSHLASESDQTLACHENESTETSKKVNKSIKQLTRPSNKNNGVCKEEVGECKINEKEYNASATLTKSGISGAERRKSSQDISIFGNVTEQTEQDPNSIGDAKEQIEGKADQSCVKHRKSVLIGRMTRSRTSRKELTSATETLKDDSTNKLLTSFKEFVPRNSLEDPKNNGELKELVEGNVDCCWSKEHGNCVLSDSVTKSRTLCKHPTTAKENLNVGNSFVENDHMSFQLNGETSQALYSTDKSMDSFNHPISNKVTGTEDIDDRGKENEIIFSSNRKITGSSSLQPDYVSDIIGFTNNASHDVGSRPEGEPKCVTTIDELAGSSYNPMDMLISEEKDGSTNPMLSSNYEDVEIRNYDDVPVLESFIMDADNKEHISEDGLCLEKLDIPENTLSFASSIEQLCKSACLHPPVFHNSTTFRMPETQSLCQPIPDQHINIDFSFINKDVGTSYSDCLPCSSHESSWSGKKPCTSPIKKVWDTILSFSSSSGKKRSLNLDLPSISEENETTDVVADTFEEEIVSDVPGESAMLEPLTDITEVITEMDKNAASSSMETLNINTDFLGTNIKHNQSGNGRGSSRLRGNHNTSLGATVKQTPGLSNGRLSRAQVSGKTNLRSRSKPNNIVSNVTSFIPLVQQKQATAVATGKRDIKVKALEAAEAAKRLANKKENERKMKKEALKLERARQVKENLRQLELEKKKKEEERKRKESEMAARKRQRAEEEKEIKEKEKKIKRLEETQKQLRGHEEKLGGVKGNKVSKNCVEGNARLRSDLKNGAGKIIRVEEEQANAKGKNLAEIVPVNTNLEVATEYEHAVTNTVREQSYEMSPYQPSDDEDDDDELPNKKFIPSWASKSSLSKSVFSQQCLDPDAIFPYESFSLTNKVCLPIKLQQL